MNRPGPDIDSVTELLEETARRAILPRFRRLTGADIEQKPSPSDPHDIVTVVDREVEIELTRALMALAPSAPVIGEEAVHVRPELLKATESDEPFWLLDPIDGTKNFARGDDGFGLMVAWIVRGQAQAAWILLPARGETFVAESGNGALLNGGRVRVPSKHASDESPRGALFVRYMPGDLREAVAQALHGHYQDSPASGCAAVDYTDILKGTREFAVYYRLLPWDHAAPALILAEAGGSVEHINGTPYSVRSESQLTVVARDAAVSSRVRGWLA